MIELLLNGFVFPHAKGPIPEFIGLDTVFAIWGGMLLYVLVLSIQLL